MKYDSEKNDRFIMYNYIKNWYSILIFKNYNNIISSTI